MDATQRGKVEALIEKASSTDDAAKAINFSQAACNAAHALQVLSDIEREENKPLS